jgi:hypothetical protein
MRNWVNLRYGTDDLRKIFVPEKVVGAIVGTLSCC